jgi:hypothetical protein
MVKKAKNPCQHRINGVLETDPIWDLPIVHLGLYYPYSCIKKMAKKVQALSA